MASEASDGSIAKPLHYPVEADDTKHSEQSRPSLIDQMRRWLRHSAYGRGDASLKAALEEVLEEHSDAEQLAMSEETTLLRNMLTFGELTVSDVMIPRADIVAFEMQTSLEDVKQCIQDKRHTRMPVYEDSLDQVRGFIHMKDLIPFFCGDDDFEMHKVLRDILFVPPSMRVIDLLVEMRLASCHMVIVVDEYGGTDGLVTMENLFEEIVGEIQDEHDEDETPAFSWVSDTVAEAEARIRIDELQEELHVDLKVNGEDEEIDTLGGLIFYILGRVPAKGEVVEHPKGMRFEVLKADPRRIKYVRIVMPTPRKEVIED